MLEKVQRTATKMIPRLRNLAYEKRLKRLGMFSLRRRRFRGDMIEVFKIFFIDEDERTRRHSLCFKLEGM